MPTLRACPGHVSFDEPSQKLTTFAVESVGRLGVEGSNFIDQLAAPASLATVSETAVWIIILPVLPAPTNTFLD